MAEFAEVCKQWRRMCLKMGPSGDYLKCENCPLCVERICTFEISDIQDDELTIIEEKVTQWAAEQPEPVYPTWREWLISIGVIGKMSTHSIIADKLAMTPIHANIAQKLGLEPKEKSVNVAKMIFDMKNNPPKEG